MTITFSCAIIYCQFRRLKDIINQLPFLGSVTIEALFTQEVTMEQLRTGIQEMELIIVWLVMDMVIKLTELERLVTLLIHVVSMIR